MRRTSFQALRSFRQVVLLAGLSAATVNAFPPTPHHLIVGEVRDSIGNPLVSTTAQVTLTAASGSTVTTTVVPNLQPGANYRLPVPMDAGLTDDLYKPSALLPSAPFKISVKIGQATYLPMEMKGNYARLGLPGQSTHLDLTLGIDSDGNGLPDDWERAVMSQQGRAWAKGAIDPSAPFPGTGLTYRQVYLAGTYAMAPKDGFVLNIAGVSESASQFSFTVVKGHAYTIQGATRLGEWSTLSFRMAGDPADAASVSVYQAVDTRRLQVEVPSSPEFNAFRFFRLNVE